MTLKNIFFVVVLVICSLSTHASCAQVKPNFSDYEYHVTDDGAFGLYKPKGWTVGTQRYPNGKMVFVADQPTLSYVSLLLLETIDPKVDSVTFAGATLRNLSSQMAGVKILESRSSTDRMRTVVTYQRSGPQNVPIQGRYSFNVKRPSAIVSGYEAPAQQFKDRVPALMTVLANITVLDDQALQRMASQAKGAQPSIPPMKRRSAPDGTCALLVPEGWNLTAEKGAALCASPDGDTGFIFTVINFVGQSQIPYFDSSKIPGLHYNYMRPIDALVVAMRHFGSSNHKVLERNPNSALAAQATAYLKRKADAETAVISYTSKNGVPCVGYFDVLNSYPNNAGQWSIMPMGIWAPASQFGRSLPFLIKMAESFQINQQWAADQVRQGMANLREQMKKTSSMMSRYAEEMRQSSLASHQNRMKSSDYISYKFSTYMRGEQEWVTSLEGGKIYTTDHWGLSSGGRYIVEGPPFNYYNYQGDVKYGHIPVDSSREVFEAVKGVR